MVERVLKFWCRHFHRALLRPARGKYLCAKCLRAWPVPWEQPTADKHTLVGVLRHAAER